MFLRQSLFKSTTYILCRRNVNFKRAYLKTPFLTRSTRSVSMLSQTPKNSEVNKGAPTTSTKTQLRHIARRERLGGADNVGPAAQISIRVIGNGSRGSPNSFLLETEHTKYLFNCGEGTQRIALENKMKISKCEHIFITQRSWQTLGGLLGMCLTLQDNQVPHLSLYGPPLIGEFLPSTTSFASLNKLKVDYVDIVNNPHKDTAVSVSAVLLFDKERPQAPPAVKGQNQGEGTSRINQNLFRNFNVSYVYICQFHPGAPKLDLHKCVELGVPRGPLLGELSRGNDITLEDGRVIKKDDVFRSRENEAPVMVVDCPTCDYLDSLLASEELKQWQNREDPSKNALAVIHLSPQSVMRDSRYQEWMDRFGPNSQHILLNGSGSEFALFGVYESQCKLNLVHDRIFPFLPHQGEKIVWKDMFVDKASASDSNHGDKDETAVQKMVAAETNLLFKIRPLDGFKRTVKGYNEETFKREVLDLPLVREELANCQQMLQDLDTTETSEVVEYPETIFLGTGSATPNKGRNVSAILLRLSEERNLLLDCGEGTYGQLFRFYGGHTDAVLRAMNHIFISHMHADHHLGILEIVQERKRAFESIGEEASPLILLAPTRYRTWLDDTHNKIYAIKNDVKFMPLQKYLPWIRVEEKKDEYNAILDEVTSSLRAVGIEKMEPVEVLHCNQSFGVILTLSTGYTVVYSGDTLPCQALVEAGQNCDLLIHEATMDDYLEDQAKFKRHCTTSQAIDIGKRMKAKFTLLTHFSQRYAKIALVNDKFTENVGFAFDNMRVRPSDLKILPKLTKALESVFQDHVADMKARNDRLQWKRNQQVAQAVGITLDELEKLDDKQRERLEGKLSQSDKLNEKNEKKRKTESQDSDTFSVEDTTRERMEQDESEQLDEQQTKKLKVEERAHICAS